MAYAVRREPVQRAIFSDMNVTPFIDVLLVLLVMFIMIIPIATHALLIPLPDGKPVHAINDVNIVRVDSADRLYWNGERVDRQALLNQLAGAAAMQDQPVIRFEPDARAGYDTSARTIALIKDSGIESFAFGGLHEHRQFRAD